jgi:hypothetical protein
VVAAVLFVNGDGRGGLLPNRISNGEVVVLGLMIASGFDKRLEAVLVEASPAWLTELTRF